MGDLAKLGKDASVVTPVAILRESRQLRERHDLDSVQVYDRDGAAVPRERWPSLFEDSAIVLFVRQGPDTKVDPAYLAAARPGMFLVVLPLLVADDIEKVARPKQKPRQDPEKVAQSEPKPRQVPSSLRSLLKLHNDQRKLEGLPALELDEALCQYAQNHAEWMAQNQSMTHSNVNALLGKFSTAGENIAYNQQTENDVMNDWMNSSGHRANIMSTNFSKVGFGVARNNGQPYWCTCFGTPQSMGIKPDNVAKLQQERPQAPPPPARPRATLAAHGVIPQLGIVEKVENDSLVFRNIRPLSVYQPRNETRKVPQTRQIKDEDGNIQTQTVVEDEVVTVFESVPERNTLTREWHALDHIEVFNSKGRAIPRAQWPRVFAQHGTVLFARFPKSGDDIQIEPAYQAAAQAGVPLVVLPVADSIEVVNEPSEADAANIAPETVFARGGVAPQISVVDSVRDGKLVFQRIETASVSGNAQKTKYVSRATPETYDQESVEIYDRQGEPVARERWEQLFATPGIVLFARKGSGTPVDPAFLAAAREGTFLVVLPEANKSQP